MNRHSVKFKITMWFTILFVAMLVAVVGILIGVSNSFIKNDNKEQLMALVQANAGELEYLLTTEGQDTDEGDVFIEYKDHFLEIDDDFVTYQSGIVVALYDNDENLVYGDSSVFGQVTTLGLEDGIIREYTQNGNVYFVYDIHLTQEHLEDLWLRGMVEKNYGMTLLHYLIRISIVGLPALVLLGILGGYGITKRSLQPLDDICEQSSSITRGEDLSKRIHIRNESSETMQLRDTMNSMLIRLQTSFDREKQFTSDASHELRTPVSVIRAECEYALSVEDSAEWKESLTVIARQAGRMSQLVNDLLLFSRLEQGSVPVQNEKIVLGVMTREVCDLQERIWKDKKIRVHLSAEDDAAVWMDRMLLSRALTNLVNNAFKYGKENGNVYIRAWSRDDRVSMEIEDDGAGISQEELPHIWTRFYQGDNARSRSDSTGLGLPMVREILSLYGAEILVFSEIGKGTRFLIHF